MHPTALPPPGLVRCQALWQLADASRHLAALADAPGPRRALERAHAEHTRAALRQSSRLARATHGVSLGQEVRCVGDDQALAVDFLRPTQLDGLDCIALSGLSTHGRRVLLFLGLDRVDTTPSAGAALWRLDARRHAKGREAT